jgi:hypothetical protein
MTVVNDQKLIRLHASVSDEILVRKTLVETIIVELDCHAAPLVANH